MTLGDLEYEYKEDCDGIYNYLTSFLSKEDKKRIKEFDDILEKEIFEGNSNYTETVNKYLNKKEK